MNDKSSDNFNVTDGTSAGQPVGYEKYLSRDWALIPVHRVDRRPGFAALACSCPRGVQCGESAGKHPVTKEWQQSHQWITVAHRSRAAMAWIGDRPLNIGLVTGRPSGVWALDFDPKNAGEPARDYVRLLEASRFSPAQETGGGGWHWLFTLPDGDDAFEITNSRGRLPTGLDVRGTGGFIVLAPSVSGKGAYRDLGMTVHRPPAWLLDMIRPQAPERRVAQAQTPDLIPPAALAPGSVDASRGHRYAAGAVRAILTELAAAREGERDAKAFEAACRLHELLNAPWAWLDRQAVRAGYEVACLRASENGSTPFTDAEADKCWTNGERRVAGKAAELPVDLPPELSPEVWTGLPPGAIVPFLPAPQAGAYREQGPTPIFYDPIPPGGVVQPGIGPGSAPSSGSGSTLSITSSTFSMVETADPFEQAVHVELARMRVREEARRRLDVAKLGDRDAAKAVLAAKLVSVADFRQRPRLEPLVDGLLYRETLTRINGPSGHGKSFITLDLAAAVATGAAWGGRAVKRADVVYMVAEGEGGFIQRLDAQEAHRGVQLDGLTLIGEPVQILGPLWPLWVELMAERRPGLVVIDTQARATDGVDEINGQDMSAVVAALDDLRRASGACVLLVHHTAARADAREGRGHGAVKGAMQTEMLVRKNGRLITVKVTKSKDDEDGNDFEFELTDVRGPTPPVGSAGAGMPVFVDPGPIGVVPVWRDASIRLIEAVSEYAGEPQWKVRTRALYLLIQRQYNPGDGGAEAVIRREFLSLPEVNEMKRDTAERTWRRSWNELVARGLLLKLYGAARRFKVVELDKVSDEGVLTANAGEYEKMPPDGWEVYRAGHNSQDGNSQ